MSCLEAKDMFVWRGDATAGSYIYSQDIVT